MVNMLGKGLLSTAMNARIICSGNEQQEEETSTTIVLAHGYGGDQSVWDKITPFLAQVYRVLVFDWSFSGAIKDPNTLFFDDVKYNCYDAFADDLIALLEEMNLKSTVFIGHSMSGMIGCIASVKRPDLFKSLVLIGASPRYLNSEDYEGGFSSTDIDQLLLSIGSNYENWAPAFVSLVVDPNDPHSVEKFTKCMLKMRPKIALSLAKTVFLSDQRDVLEKVTTPCTIIQTTNDLVVPNSIGNYMKKKINGKSTVEMIDVHGHFPQLTAHVKLLEVLGRVLGMDTFKA